MKARNGFVSNSSSSSFVVPLQDSLAKYPTLVGERGYWITQDQLNILIQAGFTPMERSSAHHLETTPWDYEHPQEGMVPIEEATCMTYRVACNEADVVYFLLKLGVPFTMAGHYGHYTIIYPGGTHYYECENPGLANEGMVLYRSTGEYNWNRVALEESITKPAVEKLEVAQFLLEYEDFEVEYEDMYHEVDHELLRG